MLLVVLHLQWYHCFGFLHSISGGGFVGESRATSSAKHQTSGSTSYLASKIVASSPELGDIARIRTGPDDDEDSFLSKVGTCLLHTIMI